MVLTLTVSLSSYGVWSLEGCNAWWVGKGGVGGRELIEAIGHTEFVENGVQHISLRYIITQPRERSILGMNVVRDRDNEESDGGCGELG